MGMIRRVMTYDDAEKLRRQFGMTRKRYCTVLGVSYMQYWRWKTGGVSETAQQLLRILEEKPEMIISIMIND